jgi:hypothetical protein
MPRREFVDYTPSSWEKTWYSARDQFINNDLAMCELFAKEGDKAEKWISAMAFSATGVQFIKAVQIHRKKDRLRMFKIGCLAILSSLRLRRSISSRAEGPDCQ